MKTIVYDLESTGAEGFSLFSNIHQILQICCFCIETGEVFESYVKPDGILSIPPQSTLIHNIKDFGSESFETVFDEMLNFFGKDDEMLFIAHNNDFFDELMLRRHLKQMPSNISFFDSLPWLRKNLPEEKSYRLGDLYESLYKKPLENAHNAIADVMALTSIYKDYILPKLKTTESPNAKVQSIIDDVLTSIRYIGPYRANLICNFKFDTVTKLRDHFKEKGKELDKFLYNKINVRDLTQRRVIIAMVLKLPVYNDDIMQNYMVTLQTDIDYYILHRYYPGLVKTEKDNRRYNRGLFLLKNIKNK